MTPEAGIEHHALADKGAFLVHRDGKRIAELSYALSGGIVSADHTFVDPQFRGTPLASSLVESLVRWARKEGHKVDPRCPYVRRVFDRTPEYADVRQPG